VGKAVPDFGHASIAWGGDGGRLTPGQRKSPGFCTSLRRPAERPLGDQVYEDPDERSSYRDRGEKNVRRGGKTERGVTGIKGGSFSLQMEDKKAFGNILNNNKE